ncbi:MAG: TolC family protein [Deltaproteobacteria bacterium]|nr:TolC family protein [Deltaproteobacteria bacterium]
MMQILKRLSYSKILPLVITLLLLHTESAWSMSLAELQDAGIANRKIIEKYRLAVQQQKEDQRASSSPFWPQLDVSYNANLLDEETSLENEENSYLMGSLSYNLFSGFRDRYNVLSSEMLKNAKEFDLQDITQEIKYRIAVRYIEIYRAKNRLEISRGEVVLITKQHRDAVNRYKVGLIRKNDMLKLKVQLDDSIQKMDSDEAAMLKSLNHLCFESGTKISKENLLFEEFLRLPEVKNFASYQAVLKENQSRIKGLESVISAKKQTVESFKSAYYPSVDISANYKKYGDDFTFGLEENGEDEIRFQMDVNLNLFDGFKKQADIQKSRIEVKRTASDLHELKAQLETDLKNILNDLEVADKNLKLAESSVSLAEENQRVSDVAFKEGVESATDVLVTVLSLSRAKFNAIDARSKLFLKYYQLIRIIENL